MSGKAATVAFHSTKNCFINLPKDWTHKLSREKIAVFEVQGPSGSLYTSWAGGATVSTTAGLDTVQINGLFGWKQDIQHGNEVLVSQVTSMPACSQIFVEPVTITDWEILELHAASIETGLLRQVRAVWLGQVIPIWVGKNICIFVRIGNMVPSAKCCLLQENSEVIVSPKSRGTRPANRPSGDGKRNSSNGAVKNKLVDKNIADKSSANDRLSVGNRKPRARNLSGNKFVTDLKNAAESYNEKPGGSGVLPNGPSLGASAGAGDTDTDQGDGRDSPASGPHWMIQKTVRYFRSWWSGQPLEDARGSTSTRATEQKLVYEPEILSESFDCFLRVQSLDSISKGQIVCDGRFPVPSGDSECQHCSTSGVLVSQPSTIFISRQTFLQHSRTPSLQRDDVTKPYLATLSKVLSPIERDEVQSKKLRRDQLLTQTATGQSAARNDAKQENDLEKLDNTEKGPHRSVTVRVVVTDCDHCVTMVTGSQVAMGACASNKCSLKQLSLGHAALPDLLRNQLGFETTATVRLTAIKQEAIVPKQIKFSPLFTAPPGYNKDMLLTAADTWCQSVSHITCPLVISQGTVVQVPIKPDFSGYFLITYQVSKPPVISDSYCLLSPAVLSSVQLVIGEQLTVSQLPQGLGRMAYSPAEDVDLPVPRTSLEHLGAISHVSQKSTELVDIALAQKPLASALFRPSPGVANGGILLCGSRGMGKSSLGHALCRYAAEWPNLAYVSTLDCKALRGKRLESIRKTLERHLEEASWRQPSVVLLDDLDHLTAAPSGPEQEMSGEALYYSRVAEVVKELMDKELHAKSKLVVMATSKSRSSIHQGLVASRGKHYFQEVVQMSSPCQADRTEILKAILLNKTVVSPECINDLDLEAVATSSEGYVAKDIEMVVDRAIHAHMMVAPPGESKKDDRPEEIALSQSDFDIAMTGFTPSALRNVSLHQAGDLGWADIGGLHNVRKTLVETLQWPSKYPKLFASCPLRLRSGLLLYGAPGTGKTLLAGVVAKECGLNFISIKGPELLSKYIGASEQAVRDTFIRAQSAKPCILFFDEFDSLAPRRGHDSTGVTDRVVNQLLTQLDGVEGLEGVYVLGATSRPDLIDPALLRPGRLDKALHCPLPDESERLEILQSLTRNMTFDPDVDLTYFAQSCDHFTGADFKALLYNAQLEAIHEVTGPIRDEMGLEQSVQCVPTSQEHNAQCEQTIQEQNIQSDQETEADIQDASNINGSCDVQLIVENPVCSPKRLLFIPSLEEGSVELSSEDEIKYLKQYRQPVLPSADQPQKEHSVTVIRQSHLVNAMSGMGPSVSVAERRKYQHIYDNFVSSRGGTFSDQVSAGGKKATLA